MEQEESGVLLSLINKRKQQPNPIPSPAPSWCSHAPKRVRITPESHCAHKKQATSYLRAVYTDDTKSTKHSDVPMHVFPFGANWSPLEGHKQRTSSFTSSQPYWQFTMAHVLESSKTHYLSKARLAIMNTEKEEYIEMTVNLRSGSWKYELYLLLLKCWNAKKGHEHMEKHCMNYANAVCIFTY